MYAAKTAAAADSDGDSDIGKVLFRPSRDSPLGHHAVRSDHVVRAGLLRTGCKCTYLSRSWTSCAKPASRTQFYASCTKVNLNDTDLTSLALELLTFPL